MELQRVVCAVDFSASASDAARWVSRSFAPGASIVLAHVIELPESPKLFGHGHARRDTLLETLRIGATERLRGLTRIIPRSRAEVRSGQFADTLIDVASDAGAQLIVVGTHAARPDDWEESSGGAELLIAAARVPVLAIVQPLAGTPRVILAAMDASSQSGPVLTWAASMASHFGGSVTALHVVPSSLADTALAAAEVVFGAPPVGLFEIAAPVATSALVARVADVQHEGMAASRVTSTVGIGDAAQEILGTARRIGADVIVLGRRHAGGLRRALRGSVVHHVLRDAPCPVLIVPESTS